MRVGGIALGLLAVTAAGSAAEEAPLLPSWLTLTAADRARGEFASWFQPMPGVATRGAEDYAFFANQLRFGARVTVPHLQVFVEGEDVRLANLPDDASLPPPTGSLGPGALYFAYNGGLDGNTAPGEVFLRQAYATVADPPGGPGLALTGGRFEYADGLEVVPKDPALAWLKRARVAERLVGPFNYTNVGRSFDGVRLVYDRPELNLTAVAFHPTHGGFELSANREMGDVGVAGLAATAKGIPGLAMPFDARLFYFYYEDRRFSDDRTAPPLPVKVDNRPLAVRTGETESLAIHTIGAHAVTVVDAGPGRADGLAWAAAQGGDWGTLDQSSWAFALEAGYQLPGLWGQPWLRVGYDQSSGDPDPDDDTHETFFQLLPTARIYAQFPFFNFMNSQDTFAQILLRPHRRVFVRTDWHWLRLSEREDLWYSGGGAPNDDVFGYAGIPSHDHRNLAQMVDLAVSVEATSWLTVAGYYGHAFGQGVVRGTFAGPGADYGYLEVIARY